MGIFRCYIRIAQETSDDKSPETHHVRVGLHRNDLTKYGLEIKFSKSIMTAPKAHGKGIQKN